MSKLTNRHMWNSFSRYLHGPHVSSQTWTCSVMEISYQTFPSHGISVTLSWWLRTKDFMFTSPFWQSVLLCSTQCSSLALKKQRQLKYLFLGRRRKRFMNYSVWFIHFRCRFQVRLISGTGYIHGQKQVRHSPKKTCFITRTSFSISNFHISTPSLYFSML